MEQRKSSSHFKKERKAEQPEGRSMTKHKVFRGRDGVNLGNGGETRMRHLTQLLM